MKGPQTGLRLEPGHALGLPRRLSLFHVNEGRHPSPRFHVHAPGVEMEVKVGCGTSRVGAVEADNLQTAVFHPNAADEFSAGLLVSRGDVKGQATHLS